MAYTATQSLTTSKTPDEVVTAAQDVFTSMGMRPNTQGTSVIAASGSFLMTWILGFLGPDTNMPIRVTVDAATGGAVNISAVDTYPIPIKLGISGKIHRRADLLAQETRQGLEQKLA